MGHQKRWVVANVGGARRSYEDRDGVRVGHGERDWLRFRL
jgi:hypothetical protein